MKLTAITKFNPGGISALIFTVLFSISCNQNWSLNDDNNGNNPAVSGPNRNVKVQSATASSQDRWYGPSRTIDGYLTNESRWSAQGMNEWIKFDLGNEQKISSIDILFYRGDERKSFFSLELSLDGNYWDQVYYGSSNGNAYGYENFSFFPVRVRYIKITGRGNTMNDWNSIIEVKMNQEMRHKILKASPSSWDESYFGSKTIDGNINNESRWSSRGLNEWITCDLGFEQNVSSIDILFFRGDERRSFFSIELSIDGIGWQQVFDGSSIGSIHDFEKFDFPDSRARYVKYIGYGNTMNDWNSIVELKINQNISADSSSWNKSFGGKFKDAAGSIVQTTDGGYIAAGQIRNDISIVKLTGSGDEMWSKIIAGGKANSIDQTYDRGYIIAGEIKGKMYIARLDSSGDEIWNKTIDGDSAKSVKQTRDGGFIAAGYSFNLFTGLKMHILKLDEHGNISWNKSRKGAVAKSIEQTRDGGYIIGGYIASGARIVDMYIVKLDGSGNEMWNKIIIGQYIIAANEVHQTRDGGYIAAGERIEDMYVVKLDQNGNIMWDRSYGRGGMDSANSIEQTFDGGYIVAGQIEYFGLPLSHMYILKLDSSGNVMWNEILRNKKAASVLQSADGGYVIAGSIYPFADSDMYIMKIDNNGECEGCQ